MPTTDFGSRLNRAEVARSALIDPAIDVPDSRTQAAQVKDIPEKRRIRSRGGCLTFQGCELLFFAIS